MEGWQYVGKGPFPFQFIRGRPAIFCKNNNCPGTPSGQTAMVYADHAVRPRNCIHCNARFKRYGQQIQAQTAHGFPPGYTGPAQFSHNVYPEYAGWEKGKGLGKRRKGKGNRDGKNRGLGKGLDQGSDPGGKPERKGKGGKGKDGKTQYGKANGPAGAAADARGRLGKAPLGQQRRRDASGNSSRASEGGYTPEFLSQIISECMTQGLDARDQAVRDRVAYQLSAGPTQHLSDAHALLEAACRKERHVKLKASQIAASISKLVVTARQKQAALDKALQEVKEAHAERQSAHDALNATIKEQDAAPIVAQSGLPELGPQAPLDNIQAYFAIDSVFGRDWFNWKCTGCLGPEPMWPHAVPVGEDDSEDEALARGTWMDTEEALNRDFPSQKPAIADLRAPELRAAPSASSDGVGIESRPGMAVSTAAPILTPQAKASSKHGADRFEPYGKISSKHGADRLEPYDAEENPLDEAIDNCKFDSTGLAASLVEYRQVMADCACNPTQSG